LDGLQRAVIEGEQVDLGYVARDRAATTRRVHPLGLAAKGTVWYLVANTDAGLRTFRVDRVASVDRTGEAVVRPEGFELSEAWRMITEKVDELRTPVRASVAAAPDVVHRLRWLFGTCVRVGPARDDGRISVDVAGHDEFSIAAQLA